MVKSPKIRHSKSHREPVTIDLEPGAVSRVGAEASSPPDPIDESATEALVADMASSSSQKTQETPETMTQDPPFAFGRGTSEPSDGSSETSGARAKPAPQVAEKRSGGTSAIAAGIIGGVIALAGGGALQFAGFLPSAGDSTARITTDGVTLADMDGLRAEIAALKQSAGAGNTQALEGALADATGRIDGLTTGLEQAKAELIALRTSVDAGSSGGDVAGAQALTARITEIEAMLAKLSATEAAPVAALDAMTAKVASIEAATNAATDTLAATGDRVTAVEKSVAGLAEKLEAQASQPKVALAIAAAALKAAVERGGPFTAEVDTFAAIAPDSPDLPALRDLAAKGVQSRADILAGATDAGNAMIDAARVVDPNAGFFDRLLSSAESLVTVRPIGVVEGAGVPAIVARMLAALKDGDLAKAVDEYETLPEAPKAAGAAYAGSLKARIAAETLVEKALAGAVKA